jgi:uncharacterized protein (UPF0333 family)
MQLKAAKLKINRFDNKPCAQSINSDFVYHCVQNKLLISLEIVSKNFKFLLLPTLLISIFAINFIIIKFRNNGINVPAAPTYQKLKQTQGIDIEIDKTNLINIKNNFGESIKKIGDSETKFYTDNSQTSKFKSKTDRSYSFYYSVVSSLKKKKVLRWTPNNLISKI